MFAKISSSIVFLLGVSSTVMAHMSMTKPAPRNSKYNSFYKGDAIDYNMDAPLNDGYAYPCRGYGAGPSVATYTAGGSVQVQLDGGAPHNGGHCQFSLSVDGGKTFVVLKTVLGDCMIATRSYTVDIPKSAPNGKVIFGWTWINKTGNREYYMNCADITIQGGSGQCVSGPKNLIANLPGYTTIPEFTSGGYDGTDLLNKRPYITSCSNGSTSNGNDPKPQPKPETKPTPTKGGYKKPQPTASPNPQPEEPKPEPKPQPPTEGSGKCEIKCLGGADFQICGNGGATPFRMKCAPGTTCHMVSGQAACY
ncbi:hypothetical protein K493DRAFT_213751 [Basidiobolus meristosporus CBS 931.73]|uniref:Uncharacterized protein n=1 Tax=Basidiobolus meristosporus CBS 931.73 TaxID=1314790 RepID=A0A1Y1YLD5_9FUNG|nr:hypothetical protein K493DRAFT_213751 [Basidiobolus meristosporus CBS 931.73]|eukprot:ORX98805.1 hypothetical protein K493DRAFT_213751 [Basidiobolus meristosporus CBS 931.73]